MATRRESTATSFVKGVTPEQWRRVEPKLEFFRRQSQVSRCEMKDLRAEMIDLIAFENPDPHATAEKQQEIRDGQQRMRRGNSSENQEQTMTRRAVVRKTPFAVFWVSMLLLPAACTTLAPTPTYKDVREKAEGSESEPLALSSSVSGGDAGAGLDAAKVPEVAPLYASLEKDGLTLEECIALALENSAVLLAAEANASAARAEKRIKGAARWPTIHVTGSYFHYQDVQRLGVPSPPGQPQYFADDIVSADIIMRLPLYAGGRIINEYRVAELLAQAEEHRLDRSREETVFNVTSTYYNILAQEKVIESVAFSKDTLAQHLARVESLIAAEKAARVDALRTGVRLADVEHQLLQETYTLGIQHRLLANFMGLSDAAADGLKIAGPLEPLQNGGPLSVEEVVARAFNQRDDYAAAVSELEAQAKRVDVARGEREPEVTLEASYGGRWGIGGSGDPTTAQPSSAYTVSSGEQTSFSTSRTTPFPNGGSLTTTNSSTGSTSTRISSSAGVEAADSSEDVARVGLAVDIPVFEGGRLRAQIAKEHARLRVAQQQLRKLEQDIRLEAETAVLNVNSARKRIHVTQKSIAEAEESVRIERQKYDLGKGAIVDVLDAQAALLNAQTNYYRALSDYRVAQAQIRLATGDKGS